MEPVKFKDQEIAINLVLIGMDLGQLVADLINLYLVLEA